MQQRPGEHGLEPRRPFRRLRAWSYGNRPGMSTARHVVPMYDGIVGLSWIDDDVAEWLGAGLQNQSHESESARLDAIHCASREDVWIHLPLITPAGQVRHRGLRQRTAHNLYAGPGLRRAGRVSPGAFGRPEHRRPQGSTSAPPTGLRRTGFVVTPQQQRVPQLPRWTRRPRLARWARHRRPRRRRRRGAPAPLTLLRRLVNRHARIRSPPCARRSVSRLPRKPQSGRSQRRRWSRSVAELSYEA